MLLFFCSHQPAVDQGLCYWVGGRGSRGPTLEGVLPMPSAFIPDCLCKHCLIEAGDAVHSTSEEVLFA